MFGKEITGLILRDVLSDSGLPFGQLLRTDSVYIGEIGCIVHCTILNRYLGSEEIVKILADAEFEVLCSEELDTLVEKYPRHLPLLSLNALGSHWSEGGQEVVRRYSPDEAGRFVKRLGIFNAKWANGHWFSCKVMPAKK
jgi:hypothetical protein